MAPHSNIETYAAFRFLIDNWRWAGVPFYVQAGKRLAARKTEVEIKFKAIPEVLFAKAGLRGSQAQPPDDSDTAKRGRVP